MGSPTTGKQLRLTGTFIYPFKNGKEVEALPFPDNLSLFQQLGIKPPG
jgi:predicted ester cyclase